MVGLLVPRLGEKREGVQVVLELGLRSGCSRGWVVLVHHGPAMWGTRGREKGWCPIRVLQKREEKGGVCMGEEGPCNGKINFMPSF
jgi:hypothetical protein